MKIVTLIGSTRHKAAFERAMLTESIAGNVVLTVACYGHADGVELSEEELKALHDLHRTKIHMSDEVLVVSLDSCLGKSTSGELEYARSLGKEIRFVEAKRLACVDELSTGHGRINWRPIAEVDHAPDRLLAYSAYGQILAMRKDALLRLLADCNSFGQQPQITHWSQEPDGPRMISPHDV